MKKLVLSFLLAIFAIGMNAQVTMNVRAGGGMNTDDWGLTGLFQVNIPFSHASNFTFSPSIQANISLPPDRAEFLGSQNILLPLDIGYKIPIGLNSVFFPKIGPAIGYDIASHSGFNIGPSVELTFEIKHFVFAVNGYYSIPEGTRRYERGGNDSSEGNVWNASLTFGYKF